MTCGRLCSHSSFSVIQNDEKALHVYVFTITPHLVHVSLYSTWYSGAEVYWTLIRLAFTSIPYCEILIWLQQLRRHIQIRLVSFRGTQYRLEDYILDIWHPDSLSRHPDFIVSQLFALSAKWTPSMELEKKNWDFLTSYARIELCMMCLIICRSWPRWSMLPI